MSAKKITLVLVCVIAVLGISCYIMSQSTKNEIEEETVLKFDENEISSINVTLGGEEFSWSKSEDSWSIDEAKFELDKNVVSHYMSEILHIKGRLMESGNENPEAYGLDNPQRQIEYVFKDGSKKAVKLGNLTPAQTEYYMSDEENNLYVIYTSSGDEIKKGLMDFADTLICSIPYESIVKIDIKGENSFSIDNGGSEEWSLVKDGVSKSLDTETVKIKVTKYLGKMYALSIHNKTEENLKKYTTDKNSTEVIVYIADGSERHFEIINMTEDKCYFTLDNGEYIYEATKSYFEFINGI